MEFTLGWCWKYNTHTHCNSCDSSRWCLMRKCYYNLHRWPQREHTPVIVFIQTLHVTARLEGFGRFRKLVMIPFAPLGVWLLLLSHAVLTNFTDDASLSPPSADPMVNACKSILHWHRCEEELICFYSSGGGATITITCLLLISR